MTAGGQLLLDFPRIDAEQRPLIESAAYRAVLNALRRWRKWPGGQLGGVGRGILRQDAAGALVGGAGRGCAVVSGAALARAGMDEISAPELLGAGRRRRRMRLRTDWGCWRR